jgi:hypothetical protein
MTTHVLILNLAMDTTVRTLDSIEPRQRNQYYTRSIDTVHMLGRERKKNIVSLFCLVSLNICNYLLSLSEDLRTKCAMNNLDLVGVTRGSAERGNVLKKKI